MKTSLFMFATTLAVGMGQPFVHNAGVRRCSPVLTVEKFRL